VDNEVSAAASDYSSILRTRKIIHSATLHFAVHKIKTNISQGIVSAMMDAASPYMFFSS